MSLQFLVNQTPATCAVAMWNLINHLTNTLSSNKWLKTKDSDGSSYSSSGAQVTGGASGANGLDNAKAWVVLNFPGSVAGVGRSFCIQRQNTTGANTSYQWRIKYSKAAGFVGGSPAATVTPSAADEQIILGGGSDASPTFAALFVQSTDGTFRQNIAADNASPSGFVQWNWTNTTGAMGHAFGLDPIVDPSASDTDPYVIHLMGTANAWTKTGMATTGGQMCGWGDVWCARAANPYMTAASLAVVGGYEAWFAAYTVANVFDGKDDLLPIYAFKYNTTGNTLGYKGMLTYVRGIGYSAGRQSGNRFTISSAYDGVAVGTAVVLPWDGSSVPTV